MSWFQSYCSPNRNPILENQLTDFSLYYNNTEKHWEEHDLILLPRFFLLNCKRKQEQTKYNAEQNRNINASFVPNGGFPKNKYFHVLLGPLQCAKFSFSRTFWPLSLCKISFRSYKDTPFLGCIIFPYVRLGTYHCAKFQKTP